MTSQAPSSARRTRSGGRSRTVGAGSRTHGRADLIELLPPAALLVVALLLGGSANPICDMVIDCLAVLLLAMLAIRSDAEDWRRARLGWLMVLATLAIAAIELVPLPFGLWQRLPGRAAPAAALETLGLAAASRPLSLDPNATVSTLLQVIPGLAIFVAVLAAGTRTRQTLVTILIAGALACTVLGSLQVAGQQQFYLYEHSNFGQLTGLFANHNHAADMLLIGIALLAGRYRDVPPGRPGVRALIAALMFTLGVSVLLTASRFGITLLAIEVAAISVALFPPSTRRGRMVLAILLCACAAVALVLSFNTNVAQALDRFNDFSGDLRTEIWRRTAIAAATYWPVGSGLGTFVPIYAGVERLDTMPSAIINHAHDEYLELVCELGLVGALIVVGYVAALVTRTLAHVRQGSQASVLPALAGIVVLLASSSVEFPLRNESLMVSFGLLNALIFCAARQALLNNR